MNLLPSVIPEISNLYKWLEEDFQPLTLCNKIKTILDFLEGEEDYVQYVKPLREISAVRMLKQVNKIFFPH